ncbi:hypothetical protein Vqi01_59710 [Micromonospora qiuiae]|uniref:Uncharacterized protein n=1 Tax=Micromonospora qiuiae TaxID=502268 RepID=A0ABQ4JMS7_9ACTN|nr:hypothetical protein Vqi01_59710 [Micromonospora qiuiae]
MTPPPQRTGRPAYGLASLEEGTQGAKLSFRFDAELDAAEYRELEEALKPVLRLGVRDVFKLVARSYEEIESLNTYYLRLFGLPRERGRIQPREAATGFMSSCVNWLNVVRLFLDHEETWLKRTFGETSTNFVDFKSACSRAFDSSIAYRFLYKLRNYTTHCGLPISSVNLDAPTEEERAAGLHQRISFRLNRDDLLRDFSWGAKVRADLAAMEPAFELLPLIRQAMPHLDNILQITVATDVRECLQALPVVRRYLDRMTVETAQPCLLRLTPNDLGGYQISPMLLPMDAIAKLETVDPAGDLLAPFRRTGGLVRPGPPTMSPEGRYRMKRGSLVLSAHLHEGGPSPAFFNTVNQLIDEDGDIEPVLTGTINLGMTLLHLASMATNTTPQSILASFGEGDEDRARHQP